MILQKIVLIWFPRNFVSGRFVPAARAAAVLLAATAAALLAGIRTCRAGARAARFGRPSKNQLTVRGVLQ